MTVVVNVKVKRRGKDHVMWGLERRAQANLWGKASKQNYDGTKTGVHSRSREEHGKVPTYWPCGVRCREGVNLVWAFVRNLRTWLAMVREKAQAVAP